LNPPNISACNFGKTIGKLQAGNTIHINSIEKHKISDLKSATKVYFIGTASLPEIGEFNFYYLYGHEGYYENQPW
jgi:hypothetical protein